MDIDHTYNHDCNCETAVNLYEINKISKFLKKC